MHQFVLVPWSSHAGGLLASWTLRHHLRIEIDQFCSDMAVVKRCRQFRLQGRHFATLQVAVLLTYISHLL
jgi:hypothetical protein